MRFRLVASGSFASAVTAMGSLMARTVAKGDAWRAVEVARGYRVRP